MQPNFDVNRETPMLSTPKSRFCECESGLYAEEVFDGHGIHLFRACEACRIHKLSFFREDILENYKCDEDIDAEHDDEDDEDANADVSTGDDDCDDDEEDEEDDWDEDKEYNWDEEDGDSDEDKDDDEEDDRD
jgi:hypothetical protein